MHLQYGLKSEFQSLRCLEHNANCDAQNPNASSPIIFFLSGGIRDCTLLRMLLHHHANVALQDQDGWTALHHAADQLFPEAVDLLLQAGAPTQLFDKEKRRRCKSQ